MLMDRTEFTASRESWVAFLISVAILVLFAFFFMYQIHSTRTERVVETETDFPDANPRTEISGKDIDPGTALPPELAIKELVRAWNHNDTKSIAGLFVHNGVLVIPTGSEIHSRDEIQKTISDQRGGILKETTLTNTVDEVSNPATDSAIVKGTYRIDGIKFMGFDTSANGSYVFRQIKRDGRWLISRAEVMRQ